MRTRTILISERDFVYVVAGQLYDQAPNRQPRFADTIMRNVRDAFRNDDNCVNDNEFRSIRIEESKVYEWVDSLLKGIKEFVELNLSQVEFENGVHVDDLNRSKYSFVTRYDVETEDSWKSDFIDLDAFIRNVVGALIDRVNSNNDCFLCKHQPKNSQSTLSPGASEVCQKCILNSEHKNNYESNRYPRGKYTFACAFDCYKSRYICCEECDDKDSCLHRCDSNSSECGNKLETEKGCECLC